MAGSNELCGLTVITEICKKEHIRGNAEILKQLLAEFCETPVTNLIENSDVTSLGGGQFEISTIDDPREGYIAITEDLTFYEFDGTVWTLKFAGLGDFIATGTDNGDDTYTFTSFDGNTSFTIAIPLLSIEAGTGIDVDVTDPKRPSVGLNQATQEVVSSAVLRVENIEQLRQREGFIGSSVILKGYYDVNDGGGGLFYWDPLSEDADDSGTIIKVNSITTGRWMRMYNNNSFKIEYFGAKGDGSTDDTAALTATLNLLKNTGGVIDFLAKTYRIDGQVIMPDDEAENNPKIASFIWRGAGSMHTGRGTEPVGGTQIDMRYDGAYGKLVSLGLGYFEITGITFKDTGSSSTSFIYGTYTTFHIHDCGFYGNKVGINADQDAIVLGGVNQVEGPRGWDVGFQGYGTVIKDNYFSRIRRAIYGRAFFNANIIQNNTVWTTCGNSLPEGSCIELDGDPIDAGSQVNAGNVITGNLIECPHYKHAIKLRKSHKNTLAYNNFYDTTGLTTEYYYLESTAQYNLIIAGFKQGTVELANDTAYETNTIINPSQYERSNFSERVFFKRQPIVSTTDYAFRGVMVQDNQNNGFFFRGSGLGRVFLSSEDPNGVVDDMFEFRDSGAITRFRIKSTEARIISDGVLRLQSNSPSDPVYIGDTTAFNIYVLDGKIYTTKYGGVKEFMPVYSGNTANRPTTTVIGLRYFDTDLGLPIYWDGSGWVDATGNSV